MIDALIATAQPAANPLFPGLRADDRREKTVIPGCANNRVRAAHQGPAAAGVEREGDSHEIELDLKLADSHQAFHRPQALGALSHALVVLEDGIIQSTFKAGGVRKGRLQDALKHASVANVLAIDLKDEAAALAGCAPRSVSPDWRACWGFAISSREWRDDYAWFCFELVAGAALAGGREVSTDASLITAYDLVELAHG